MLHYISFSYTTCCRSQWPRGLRRRSSAARLLRLWVRIPPRAWMFVCCECCVLSGTGLCDGFIARPNESYRMWRVVVCDQETSKTRRQKPIIGLWKYNHNGLKRQENKQVKCCKTKKISGYKICLRVLHNLDKKSNFPWKTLTGFFNCNEVAACFRWHSDWMYK